MIKKKKERKEERFLSRTSKSQQGIFFISSPPSQYIRI